MSSGGCSNCPDSPWIQKAKQFISNPNNPRDQIETVEFLLHNGNCGIDNRVSITVILDHLEEKGISMGREEFQNTILTELKRQGILATLVYPGPQGGVFIPCNELEVKEVVMQVFGRIAQELTNLEGTAEHTQFKQTVSILRRLVELLKERI